MFTLTFTPGPNIVREALTGTIGVEYANARHLFSVHRRPVYKFTLQLGPLVKSEVECLTALHAYHQGARSFFWDGGEYGTVENYQLVDEGNGTKTQMYMPNRYIGVNSIAVRTLRGAVSSEWSSGYSLSPTPGLLTFATAPVSGDFVQAKYGCQYKVNFAADGLTTQEIAAGLWSAEVVLTENVLD